MKKPNQNIRDYAKSKGVELWKIAAKLGIVESTLYVRLRRELTPADTARYMQIVDEIAAEIEA